jgi:hypothetical protein
MKAICDCKAEAEDGDCKCAAEVMLAMLEALEAVAVVGREAMSVRVWARARARMARKASWSVVQVLEVASTQAASVRVPFVLLLLRPEAKVVAIAGTREAWRAVQRVWV